MANLHLPVKHTDDDVALAGALAQLLRSGALYVAWSTEGGPAEPAVPAKLVLDGVEEAPPAPGILARVASRLRRRR